MTIYIDELFIKNFTYSYLILTITAEILNIKYNWKKCILSSTVTSILSIVAIIFDINEKVIIKIIILLLYTYMAYTPQKFEKLIIEMVGNICLTFLLGGIISSSINKIQEIILFGIICLFGIRKYIEYYQKKKWTLRNIYKIEIEAENKKIGIKAFLDTGNMLKRIR